jgi:hypothetical protein
VKPALAILTGLIVCGGTFVILLNHNEVSPDSETVWAASPHREHPRSRAVTEQFQRENPCPSTGKTTGACPNYIRDHICALAIGGADSVDNLQWQSVADSKLKDSWETDRNDPRNAHCLH